GVNDILIAAAILNHQAPEYYLERFMLERDLAHEPFNALWHGKPYSTVPDLFLDLRQTLSDGRQRSMPIIIEHDGATGAEEVIRKKVHAYSAMIASGWYKQRYGINTITVAFTTCKGEKQGDKLRAWAREELRGEDRSLTSCFLFTSRLCAPDPTHLWLAPCWYTPYMEDKPVMILGD
ncbi:MAG TPA: hypothetical protein VKX46_08145, partial [Ktedonobacteraceae bacterium]|nr:hypothetical protein [Ktedonobacteraceae bacterium]